MINPPQPQPEPTPTKSGSRRLAILGIGAVLIALISSGISLVIYTASGDIYLDRSRPGFISDTEKPNPQKPANPTPTFPADGPINQAALDAYLKNLDLLIGEITAEHDAFSADSLSDEALNITGSADDQ